MPNSSIDGRAAPFEAAIAAAAKLLHSSRLPVIAGLGCDVAGVRAAVRLAEALGAVIDHMHSAAMFSELDVMREHGMMLTTPNETRRRADVVLLVGDGLEEAGLSTVLPDLGRPSLAPLADARPGRKILRLGGKGKRIGGDLPLAALLARVRARVNGKAVAAANAKQIDQLVETLRGTKFGVAAWAPAALDSLTLEMLCGLVKDLNAHTRFSGLSLSSGDHAAGVLQVCGWMTGFPMRTSFARGYPDHDGWLYEATRLVAEGEADCALWVSALGAGEPAWSGSIPTIALTPASVANAAVHIAVGRPGVDHEGILLDARLGSFTTVGASQKSATPSVAAILDAIAHELAGCQDVAC